MGYVDVGEEDYWEAEGERGDDEDYHNEHGNVDVGKKRRKVDEDPKGTSYITRWAHYTLLEYSRCQAVQAF